MSNRLVAGAAALALWLAPALAAAAQVWVSGSTQKIRPDARPGPATEARLSAAGNELEAFQVVVTGAATAVSASASPLTGPGTLDDVKLYREDLLTLDHPSALDGATGEWPDALVPDVDDVVGEKRNAFPFDVGEGQSRAIWVEVRVPSRAAPGLYHGAVQITAREGKWSVPVTLRVWDFELPSTASLRSSFGLSYGGTRTGHPGLSEDEQGALRGRYAQLGLDHRISLSGVGDDGSGDLGLFDARYGPLLDGTAPTRLPGARLTAVKYVGDETSSGAKARWAQHFRGRGWLDRLFDYVCDEPPLTCAWSDIPARAAAAHAADPAFRTLVTTQIWDAQDHGVAGDVDLMVPVLNWTDDKPGSAVAGDQRARYDSFLSRPGTELWLYQSCMSHGCGGTVDMGSPSDADRYFTGWPSYVVDAAAVRNRAMEWVSFLERATGELYWETTAAYAHDPWSNLWDFTGNGDGTLFYPGTPARIGGHTDIPVASIRLKMIREGMEDYEYLKLLADLGDRPGAEELARGLFPDAWSTDVDPARLVAARDELAARILQRLGKAPAPALAEADAGTGTGPSAGGGGGGGCSTGGAGGALALLWLAPFQLLLVFRRRYRA